MRRRPCQFVSDAKPDRPKPSDLVNQFLQGLRQQGLTVMLADDTPRELHPFFSPPPQQVLANDGRVTLFGIRRPAAPLGRRPSCRRIVSRVRLRSSSGLVPRFYPMDRLIALYVGCSTEIVRALETTMGSAFVIGGVPCRRAS